MSLSGVSDIDKCIINDRDLKVYRPLLRMVCKRWEEVIMGCRGKRDNRKLMNQLASIGNVHTVEWALKNGFKLYTTMYVYAAQKGQLQFLKFLKSRSLTWHRNTLAKAAAYGDLECMKWLEDNGCPWSTGTFLQAVCCGKIENLQWLKDRHCPVDYKLFETAVRHGKIEVLDWLTDNKCQGTFIGSIAARYNRPHVLEWLQLHNHCFYETTFETAVLWGHIDSMKWLKENNCPYNYEKLMKVAKYSNNESVVEWIRINL